MQRSIGHLTFSETHEYVQLASGDVYRAPIVAPVMPDGLRGGLRFEGTAAWWREHGHTQLALPVAA